MPCQLGLAEKRIQFRPKWWRMHHRPTLSRKKSEKLFKFQKLRRFVRAEKGSIPPNGDDDWQKFCRAKIANFRHDYLGRLTRSALRPNVQSNLTLFLAFSAHFVKKNFCPNRMAQKDLSKFQTLVEFWKLVDFFPLLLISFWTEIGCGPRRRQVWL